MIGLIAAAMLDLDGVLDAQGALDQGRAAGRRRRGAGGRASGPLLWSASPSSPCAKGWNRLFLLAIFQQSEQPGAGASAQRSASFWRVAIGYAIYALGVKLNLRAFFRWTGILILFVAAGLAVNAVRFLHEAGCGTTFSKWLYDLGTTLCRA